MAEAVGISGAYLLKLEKDDVQAPSPHVLHRLAHHFGVSYLGLMELTGYEVSDDDRPVVRQGVLAQALLSEPLTETEERLVATFLTTLRSQDRPESA